VNLDVAAAVAKEDEESGVEAVVEEEEEAGVEAATEETGSSSVDGDGGARQSRERRGLREFWDEKRNDMGWATIYRFKNISSCSLTTTTTDSFEIRTEADLF
jgi:hypothetical protein